MRWARSGDDTSGLVLRARSGFYTVATDEGDLVEARLRGRMKRERQASDLAVIGDRVTVERLPDGTGAIEVGRAPAPPLQPSPAGTARLLARGRDGRQPRPRGRRLLLRPAAAKPAPDRPLPRRRRVQRGAGAAGREQGRPRRRPRRRGAVFEPYERIGYEVVYASAKAGIGLDELRERLAGRCRS